MSSRSLSGAIASAVGSLLLTCSAGASASRSIDADPALDFGSAQVSTAATRGAYLVQLAQAPAAVAFAEAMGGAPRTDRDAVARAGVATRARIATIDAAQTALQTRIAATVPDAQVVYRASKAMNGIVVEMSSADVARVRALPGVARVLFVEPEYPTLSTSVPFINSDVVWDSLGLGSTGEGVSVAIIDSGVDYQHPTFGGTGLLADYQANNRANIDETGPAAFPTDRVIGGWDFVGDTYTGAAAGLLPDPDPMDCGSHGTHVASTVAGGGVTSAGAAFTGPYDTTTDFGALRIGPGVAPQADLYALRVFGCGGSTNVTGAAIEWAMDPNDDGDLSDHVDVINMSLGSNFGTQSVASAISSENASLAGVIVVASAGNAGDTFTISGAPGSSTRTISVANVADDGQILSLFDVVTPPALAGRKPSANNAFTANFPPAPVGIAGTLVPVAADNTTANPIEGCSALTNGAAVSGNIALIRRGSCDFAVKAVNAQNAGAIAVVIANNAAGDPVAPGLGGAPAIPMTIPVISINTATGADILTAIGNGDVVTATINSTTNANVINTSSSRGPRMDDLAPKPDVSAPGTTIIAAQTGVVCTAAAQGCIVPNASGYIPGGASLGLSGTSMAAPHVAGVAALIRDLKPNLSVEEVKAAIMNGALHDVSLAADGVGRISTSRAGSGRVDAAESTSIEVTAFNADNLGGVTIGFDGGILGTTTQTRELRLVNHGTASVTLALEFDYILDGEGVEFTLPEGDSITLAGGASAVIPVQMTADSAEMTHPRDPTMAPTQTPTGPLASLGARGRSWLSEESALLVLRDGGTAIARVPVYAAPRPYGTVTVPSVIDTAGASSGSTSLPITGTGLCSNESVDEAACNNGEFDALSMVSAFELQAQSPRDTFEYAFNDIRYVGVATDGTNHHFGVGMYGRAQSAYANTYQVEIDTNGDNVAERVLANGDPHTFSQRLFGTQNIFAQDTNILLVYTAASSGVSGGGTFMVYNPRVVDMRVHGADVGFLTATPAQLGLASTSTPVRYRVSSCFAGFPMCSVVQPLAISDQTAWLDWNPAAPGVRAVPFLYDAQPGGTVDVVWNTANLDANNSLGLLLLQHQNADGMTQQVVTFDNTNEGVAEAAADVGVTLTVDDAAPLAGQTVTFTATVTNDGPDSPVDVQATFLLPDGLAYASHTAGTGSYDPDTGVWALAAQGTGATASLQLLATVERSGPIGVEFDAMGAVSDPNLVDNHAELDLSAASTSDISAGVVADASSVTAGDEVTFTVTVSNAGPDTAYNVNVVAAFPGADDPATGVASQGVFTAATGGWNLASLAVGASETLELTYTATNAGTFDFSANATIADNDPTVPNTAQASVTIGAAAADGIVAVSGGDQEAEIGDAFAVPFAVRAEDEFGNPVAGVSVTFTAPATGASGSFGGSATVATGTDGIATAPVFTANAVLGAYTVVAEAGAFDVAFSVENVIAQTTIGLAADDTAPPAGVDVTLTATVASDAAIPFAGGTVDFTTDGGATVLCDDVPVVGGIATCDASFDTGSVTVTALYSGTSSFASSSTSLVLTVGEPLPPEIFADGFED